MRSKDELIDRIKLFNERIWEGRVPAARIDAWLDNFVGEVLDRDREQAIALSLLASFCFYGDKEVRELLVSLYRDSYVHHEVQRHVRSEGAGSVSSESVERFLANRLECTKFLGMGNPSESGSHLLYYFRQENALAKNLFVNPYEVVDFTGNSERPRLVNDSIDHLIFMDDVLGSGTQATAYSKGLLPLLRRAAKHSHVELRIDYLVLFAKSDGLDDVRALENGFDEVRAVHVLDPSESAFSVRSRLLGLFEGKDDFIDARTVAEHYGLSLFGKHPLGWKNGQLLLGFHHNIPNNTLPIFWDDEAPARWDPVFPRYRKVD